ncbi:hypothetical protein C365_00353 [Cryptococcus neoformans Bt85]|nr:hypothetical protein C365_00353 [Cryptococcus neoformans var. grubii Bt85]OXM82239.1 hypothetical protein C364_00353 [Cryptococcus neoformans var. grubii Bt63]
MSSNSPKRERLDVESPQDREARLGQLLQSISSNPNQSQESTPIKSLNPLPSRPHVVPESDVLSRVRAFLPQFQASNDALFAQARENPDSVDIEKGQSGQYISMDLGLGVFDAPENPKGDMGPVIATQPPESLTCQQEVGDEEANSDSDGDGDSTGSSSSGSESEDETNGKVELNTENTQESKI